jgi:hypothetical protein
VMMLEASETLDRSLMALWMIYYRVERETL